MVRVAYPVRSRFAARSQYSCLQCGRAHGKRRLHLFRVLGHFTMGKINKPFFLSKYWSHPFASTEPHELAAAAIMYTPETYWLLPHRKTMPLNLRRVTQQSQYR